MTEKEDDTAYPTVEDLSGLEARRLLMRLIARQDIEEHREIYDALEHE